MHRGARAGAFEKATFFGRQIFEVIHADFVPVVEEGDAGQREQHGLNAMHLRHGASAAQAGEVVVAARDRDEAVFLDLTVVLEELLEERGGIAAAGALEISVGLAVVALERTPAAEEVIVVGCTDRDHEVDVEARGDGFRGMTPFRNQGGVRVLRGEAGADLPPETAQAGAAGGPFDQRRGHIDPEAVAAGVEPKFHDRHQFPADGARTGGRRFFLPGIFRIRFVIAVVEGGLRPEKIRQIAAIARTKAVDPVAFFRAMPHVARPVVIFGVTVAFVLLRGAEPGMVDGGVARDQVQHDAESAAVGFFEQSHRIGIGAVTGGHFAEVGNIVTRIAERGFENGIEPDGVHAERGDVVEAPDQTGQIADAVAVGVAERLRVHLIEDGVVKPLRIGAGAVWGHGMITS